MPVLWEVEAPQVGSGIQERLGRGKYAITLALDAASPDFFRTSGLRHLFLSERAASWLQAHFGSWVMVQPVTLS